MKAQLKKALRHAFKNLGDIVTPATIKHKTGSEFNDATGMVEETYTNYPVKILDTEYDKFEYFQGLITPGDLKVLLPAEQIDFVPNPSDDTLIMNGTEYGIETVTSKFDILYILKL
ncbi:MAG: hypothetical protein RBR67_19685 [Desulfobacterium sp.]|nr:hypothetical protein [Desulfobacterium sp.]